MAFWNNNQQQSIGLGIIAFLIWIVELVLIVGIIAYHSPSFYIFFINLGIAILIIVIVPRIFMGWGNSYYRASAYSLFPILLGYFFYLESFIERL